MMEYNVIGRIKGSNEVLAVNADTAQVESLSSDEFIELFRSGKIIFYKQIEEENNLGELHIFSGEHNSTFLFENDSILEVLPQIPKFYIDFVNHATRIDRVTRKNRRSRAIINVLARAPFSTYYVILADSEESVLSVKEVYAQWWSGIRVVKCIGRCLILAYKTPMSMIYPAKLLNDFDILIETEYKDRHYLFKEHKDFEPYTKPYDIDGLILRIHKKHTNLNNKTLNKLIL